MQLKAQAKHLKARNIAIFLDIFMSWVQMKTLAAFDNWDETEKLERNIFHVFWN